MSENEIKAVLESNEVAAELLDAKIVVVEEQGFSVAFYPGTDEPRSILPLDTGKPTITWLS